ncbi:DNA primase [Bergeyella zoohelcum]|uniref:DNA primase n=1 Tax=Bergeyella zoohelcum TaxID=1015 RepID=A0A376C0A2_9FLAO|nr:DNA primase [Bergeyella zoohelcum]EKB60746.1 DNA primase [Bergeyella zoohelcum CCUG 30536]SSZ47164.1 DNA primase [Bergeyella zoohelcum]
MPLIAQDFIDNVLRDVDILSVLQHLGIEVEKKGAKFFCKSPFGEEKTASCLINVSTNTFKDFSTGKFGDAVSLIKEVQGKTYPEAIQVLAELQHKTVVYEKQELTKEQVQRRNRQKDLRKFLAGLEKKFREELQRLPKSHPAWKEIEKRGYTSDELIEWGIGFAPGNNFMYQLFSEFGGVEIGKALGLINDKNQDKLWNRLVYPLYNARNEILGFASRDLSGRENAVKWMNPSDNELYNKSRELYGFHTGRNAIAKRNKCWIVEGYNDVIAWHKFGLENTVAVCGTALTEHHLQLIGKLTKKVVLCYDNDKGGNQAISRSLPLLIGQGFSVEVCRLPDNLDPDDYSREMDEPIAANGLEASLQPYLINGYEYLLQEKVQGDELDKINGIKTVIDIISKISDTMLREVYVEKLTKFSKQKQSVIRSLIQEKDSEHIRKENEKSDDYLLPKRVNTPIEILEPVIKKYGLFVSDDEIYFSDGENVFGQTTFSSISNFSIEILQHMNDDAFPMKLLRVRNIHGEERIFDVPANTLNAPQRFKDALTNNGNYQFRGNQAQLDRLAAYLYDKMGIGRKVDVLGWNAEGFYCWNNTVTIPGQTSTPIDKNGIFHFDGHTYYVPSANEIYRSNPYKFAQQKRITLHSASVTMEKYLDQMKKVHREFAIVGMLFAFAAAHQDLIVNIAKGFPIYFLYGPPSTGKDELYGCIKKMFGIAKTDFINLENKQSTGKAKLRSFAEFSNMVVHLSEYVNGDKEIDGMLKGIWDRGSYKRATMDSKVSTDSTPILCAALVTGNQSPTDDAVLTRVLYGEMTKNQFTVEEKQAFEELENMTTEGITAYMNKVIWHRPLFEAKFADKFNMYKKVLSKREAFAGAIDRIITNYSILGATHEILKETNDVIFPFTTQEMLETFDVLVSNLKRKLDASNLSNKFWDVFLACISYGNETQKLRLDVHLDIDSQYLYLRFTDVYNRIQTEWFPRFSESCPNKTTISEHLKQSKEFVEVKKSHRFGTQYNTSAFVFDLSKIDNRESIEFALNLQREATSFAETGMQPLPFGDSPATPHLNKDERDSSADSRPPF